MEKRDEVPTTKPCTHVVVFENKIGDLVTMAAGGVERRDICIKGENNFKARIPQENKLRYPLRFTNSKVFDAGKECDFRNPGWLRKGLIVEVKEEGRRQAFWDHNKGGMKSVKWEARGTKAYTSDTVGLGHVPLEARSL